MQISTRSMPKQHLHRILKTLHILIADLRKPHEVATFLQDFLSDTEYLVLAKRLAIAIMLEDGKSYEEIKKELKVSSATISSVSELMQKRGLRIALKKIKIDQWAERTAEKLNRWMGGHKK